MSNFDKLQKTVEKLRQITSGTFAHPTTEVKPAADPGKPADRPHIREDTFTEVNLKLEKGMKGDWRKEGYKLSIAHNNEPYDEEPRRSIEIHAHAPNGERVGRYQFSWNPSPRYNTISPEMAYTHEDHQRKGLATSAYSLAEQATGRYVDNSGGSPSDDAKALWRQLDRPFGKSLRKSDDDREGQFFVDFPQYANNKTKAKGGWATWHFNKRELADILRNWDTAAKWEWRGSFSRPVKEGERHPTSIGRPNVTAPIKQHIDEHKGKVDTILYHGAGQDQISADALKGIANQVDVYDPFQNAASSKDVWKRDIKKLPDKQYDQVHSHYTLNVIKKNGPKQGKDVMQEIHDRLKDNGTAVITVRRDDICAPKYQPKLTDLTKSLSYLRANVLSKAFDPIGIEDIKAGHTPKLEGLVNSIGHFQLANPVFDEYKQTDTSPDVLDRIDVKGVSPKMVHQLKSGTTAMAKPYHREVEDWSEATAMPIYGWATLANRALYEAGNIGHLCENVQAYSHEGVPVTVHPFEDDVQECVYGKPFSAKAKLPKKHGMAIQQIALMDYLTQNVDRHSSNFMWHRKTKMPLAIDHERSFQYYDHERATSAPQTIAKIMEHMISYPTSDQRATVLKGLDSRSLAMWWTKHKDAIRNQLMVHVQHINNDSYREHIMHNFDQRFNHLNQWVAQDASHSLWTPNEFGPHYTEVENKRIFKHKPLKAPRKPRQPKPSLKQLQVLKDAMPNIPTDERLSLANKLLRRSPKKKKG